MNGIASISLFKKKMFSLIRPEKKSFFGILVGIKNTIRSRLNLSKLKVIKCSTTFWTPLPIYVVFVELDLKILLICFNCQLFTAYRNSLTHTTSVILHNNVNLRQIHLYGHPKLDVALNRLLLQSTTKYINDTNRFS